jgi:hypothetical protein
MAREARHSTPRQRPSRIVFGFLGALRIPIESEHMNLLGCEKF